MGADARVCPFCGEPPGPGVFCASCGRNLGGVDRLPTRAEWAEREGAGASQEVEAAVDVAGAEGAGGGTEAGPAVAEGCAAATAAFLDAMHAAGDPGRTKIPVANGGVFRTPKVEGWIVRPVQRDDDARPRRYAPGLVLTTDGAYHRLDSEIRGWGQRDFPVYWHTVAAEPLPVPEEPRLVEELVAVLRANGVGAA